MAKKPKDDKPRDEKPDESSVERAKKIPKKDLMRGGRMRDYSQRAHDVVREVEKRHAERHKDDDDGGRSGVSIRTNMDVAEGGSEVLSTVEHDDGTTEYFLATTPVEVDPPD